MQAAAKKLDFERAAPLRDQIRSLEEARLKYAEGGGRKEEKIWGRGPGVTDPCPLPQTPSPNPIHFSL